MNFSAWKKRLEQFGEAIEEIGGESEGVVVSTKATIEEINKVEDKLGIKLPVSFVKVLTEFTRRFEFSWEFPEDFELPEEFNEIFAGQCNWNLKDLVEVEEGRKGWVEECFSDASDPYDMIWHNKLAFMEVGNGDCLAFDLSNDKHSVVYLSHDGGEGHGYVLGNDFIDFMERWTLIGCVGPEDWQILPFISSSTSGIQSSSENAKKWRMLVGVSY